ncbi:tyramine receptor Ser-2 isoform X2 [Nematostella vectensis]|uniref:tyramine receptor Ser-2-like isoform X2 n=1 Tax=Nematostella vectensis TaxID=45351 RepID=UPI0020778007|nr:tyramine receptor Ser-2-like isoform X2 [Nematostella vectensis]XP_048587235.1 tyramine receptor Ser-2 isoform X2 [Nematostella vectensis]
MMSNSTNSSVSLHLRNFDSWYAWVFAVLYCCIIVVALAGNMLVCGVVAVNKGLRRLPTNLFIVSLSVSDLITALLAMPFDVDILITGGRWDHGEVMCRVWTTVYLMTVPTSILTLLAVSLDRYKTLSDPLNRFRRAGRFMTRRRALIIIAVIWLYCLVMSILPVIGAIDISPYKSFLFYGQCVFPLPTAFSVVTSMVNFVVPLLLTCAIYAKIYRIARSHSCGLPSAGRASVRNPSEQKEHVRNVRAAKTISMFVCAFFCCWVPYCMVSVVSNLCPACFMTTPPHVYPPLLMLGYLNSALNPFLFSFRNKAFKSTVWRLWRNIKRRRHPHNTRQENGTDVQLSSLRSRGSTAHEPGVNSKTESVVFSSSSSREPLSVNDKLQIHIDTEHAR